MRIAKVIFAVALSARVFVAGAAGDRFVESVGYDTALSWVSRPGSFQCPAAYSNDSYRYVADLVQSTGVRHVRERLRWRDVASDAKTWKPGHYLDNANLLVGRGIGISGMFHDAPEKVRGKNPQLPRDPIATYDFCRKVAETFGDRMEIWEFWNEQDVSFFSKESAWDFATCWKAVRSRAFPNPSPCPVAVRLRLI